MDKLSQLTEAAQREWFDGWRTGPTRARFASIPLQPGDRAPDVELPDETGSARRLSEFWRDGPAVVLFWRHFGCGCGVERAQRLAKEWPKYEALGARVVIVGQGEPERAAAYREKHNLPCPVLCDPDRRAYAEYGLPEGRHSQLLFDAPDDMQRCDTEAVQRFADARNAAGRPPVDNPWQLPGEVVVGPGGVVRLVWRYNSCEDYPDSRVIEYELKGLPGR